MGKIADGTRWKQSPKGKALKLCYFDELCSFLSARKQDKREPRDLRAARREKSRGAAKPRLRAVAETSQRRVRVGVLRPFPSPCSPRGTF